MRVEMTGYVAAADGEQDLQFSVTGMTWLQKKLARKTTAPEYWQPTLTRAAFPLLPQTRINQAAPFYYGYISDEINNASPGSEPAGLYPRNSYDFGWSTDLGRNGWGTGSFPAGTVYLFVHAIKGGLESAIMPNSTNFLMSGASPACHVKFRSDVTPDLYRIYVTDGSSADPFADPATWNGTYTRYIDVVPSTIPEGNNPYGGPDPADANKRFFLVDSPTQGGNYRTLVGGATPIVASTGACPTIYAGEIGGQSVFIVARGAIKACYGVFVGGVRQTNVGTAYEIQCPFLGNWVATYTTNYQDASDGTRWTLVYATGQIAINAINGTAPITVNIAGIESVGNGSGSLVSTPIAIDKHFNFNFLCPDSIPLTLWQTATPNLANVPGLSMYDELSAAVGEAVHALRISGSYELSGGIGVDGKFESALDIQASLFRDGDFMGGFNRLGSRCVAVEPISTPATATTFTDVLHINDRSFSAKASLSNFWNQIPFNLTQDYTNTTTTGWHNAGSIEDAASIANYEQDRTASLLDRRWQRANTTKSTATIKDVAKRQRLRWRNPLRVVQLAVPYLLNSAYNVELGSVIRVTHYEGLSTTGWADHDVFVTKIDTDLNKLVRGFECYDLTPIYAGLDDAVEATWTSLGLQTVSTGSQQGANIGALEAGVAALNTAVVVLQNEVIAIRKRATARVATTANITISTALNNADTLDGVTLVTGDLVLVKNQSAAAENGVYVVGVTPARSSEFDIYNEHPGVLIAVEEGTVGADTLWLCTSNLGGTLNTTALVFVQKANNLGDVVGPASAVDLRIAVFDGTTGKLIKDGGYTIAGLPGGSGGSGSRVLLSTKTASASASLDFTSRDAAGVSGNLFQSDFTEYEVEFRDIVAATNGAVMRMQYSSDGGSTWQTTAIYTREFHWSSSSSGHGVSGATNDTGAYIADNIKTIAQGSPTGTVKIINPLSTTNNKSSFSQAQVLSSADGIYYRLDAAHSLLSLTAMNCVRFILHNGNMASGVISVYGFSATGGGATGAQGPQGSIGLPGEDGDDGPMGPPGVAGPAGAAGTAGATGSQGAQGPLGLLGQDGEDGADSFIPGPTGAQGAAGATGSAGLQGVQGPIGLQGDTGDDGNDSFIPGPIGATGATGSTGATGPQGPIGFGVDGQDGEDSFAARTPEWGGVQGNLDNQADLLAARNLKANIASPTLTGTPLSTTAADGTDTTQIATTAYSMRRNRSAIGTADLAIANTETVVVGITFAANELVAGSTFMFRAYATRVGTNAANPIARIRIGTTTLIGNIAATVTGAGSNGVALSIILEGMVTIRTAGAGGTTLGSIGHEVSLAAVTITKSISPSTGTVAVDTTAASQKIELTFISGQAANTYTFRNAVLWRVN